MPNYILNVNGKQVAVSADEDTPLLWVLRDELNLVGTKFGCGIAQCGACTVHINGVASRSCQLQVSILEDVKITTIEGLSIDVLMKPFNRIHYIRTICNFYWRKISSSFGDARFH